MYREALILGLIGAVLLATAHWLLVGRRMTARRSPRRIKRYNGFERLVHAAAAVSFVALAVTAFAPVLAGERMRGWWLLIHCAISSVFAVSLAAMAVMWARSGRFARSDAEWLRRGGLLLRGRTVLPAGRWDAGQKITFWLAVALAGVLTLSMALSMTRLFGPEGLETVLNYHRYSALALTVMMIWHAYFALLAKRGAGLSMVTGKVSEDWARRFCPQWRPVESSEKTP
jgi:formate dehydrogenase subunit gamma